MWAHETTPARDIVLRFGDYVLAGQEELFRAVGIPVASQTAAPPSLDAAAQAEFKAKAEALVPHYRTELLPHA
jgi:hypothetical protein